MPANCAASNTAAGPAQAELVGPIPQRGSHLVGQRVTTAREVAGRLTEEHRGGGGPHQPGAVRLVERIQQEQPFLGGIGGENIAFSGVDGGNSGLRQRGLATLASLPDSTMTATSPAWILFPSKVGYWPAGLRHQRQDLPEMCRRS